MRALSETATREVAGIVGAVIFGAASVLELVRMAVEKEPWPGFTRQLGWVMTLIAIVIWVPAAFALAKRSQKHRLLAITGAFALFCYGLLGTTARSAFGIVYVVFGVLMAVIERLAFGGKLTLGTRTAPPRRTTSGPPEVY